jgi:hypothetical protein
MPLPKQLLSMTLLSLPHAASFAPRTTTTTVLVRTFAASGVTVASPEEIQAALDNDITTVLNVRSQVPSVGRAELNVSDDKKRAATAAPLKMSDVAMVKLVS